MRVESMAKYLGVMMVPSAQPSDQRHRPSATCIERGLTLGLSGAPTQTVIMLYNRTAVPTMTNTGQFSESMRKHLDREHWPLHGLTKLPPNAQAFQSFFGPTSWFPGLVPHR